MVVMGLVAVVVVAVVRMRGMFTIYLINPKYLLSSHVRMVGW